MNSLEPSLDHWTIIFLFAAAHGLFLSCVIYFHKRGKLAANRLLASIILLFSLSLFYYVAYWTQYVNLIHRAFGIVLLFPMLFGPLFLLYFYQLNDRSFRKNDWLHFVPFALVFLWYAPIYFNADTSVLSSSFTDILYSIQAMFLRVILLNVHLIAYGIYLFVYLRRQKHMKAEREQSGLKKWKWMQTSAYCYLGYSVSFLSYYVLVHSIDFNVTYDYAISAAMTLFIYFVGYLGYRQPEILSGYQQEKAEKYVKSGLTHEDGDIYAHQLLRFMEKERPYLACDLKLDDLAQALDMSRHHLSQIINEKLNLTFSDFVNRYRINEAQRLLADKNSHHVKILAVVFDVGFNTKASFYNAFKKLTGTSPTEYRKAQLKQQSRTNTFDKSV